MVTETSDTRKTTEAPKLPPTWFKHLFWRVHRSVYGLLGDRALWTPESMRGWGAMHVTTLGRKSGERRSVILGYIDEGGSPVVLAMNGWDEGLPAWWLNLEAHPDTVIRLKGQPMRRAHARRVEGDERERLWRRWAEVDEGLDAYAASRSADTPVVVFEPVDSVARSELHRIWWDLADHRLVPRRQVVRVTAVRPHGAVHAGIVRR